MPDWNNMSPDEKIAVVGPMWRERGLTAGTIARLTSTTRNAIIGFVHRQKWQRKPPRELGPPKKKRERKVRPPVAATGRAIPKPAKINPEPAPWSVIRTLRPPLEGITPISIMELPARRGCRCRFMVQGGYCGAECGEQTYCDAHRAIMYMPKNEKGDP